MSDAGANTIVGWDERHFDELLMQKAAQHGLGVILPFDLGPGLAYEDPVVRQQLIASILQRVVRFRNSPALRMWGLGNEVLHEILRAHGTQARYDSAAQFLIQAADRIHELDPDHPVVYRDAEDWYVTPIIKALADGKSRPWFVYSMNFFTTRMRQALDSGPTHTSMHQALMISEFGPVGLRPENRPAGYRDLWDIIRDHPNTVLGGSAYVWTTAGPEPLDRNFGLTDANGQPVDGALAELAALYSSET
jgi:beta-galactosidase/beta-glucuronidase